jgi:gluconokinase
MRVVVGGVSGSGKSTVGEALARRLGLPFADGDDLHPQANVEKMRAGTPLTDEDRRPWLVAVGRWLAEHDGVVACSALRRDYRDLVRAQADGVTVLLLHGEKDLIRVRQAARGQHFMPPELMDSQFALYEPIEDDEAGAVLDVAHDVETLVAQAVDLLGAPPQA